MKRFLTILFAFSMILSLVSCGKDGGIVGKWAFGVNTIEFKDDNTVSISVNETLNYDGSYKVDGDKITVTAEGMLGEVSADFTFSLKKKSLVLTGDITLMGAAPTTIVFEKIAGAVEKNNKGDSPEDEKEQGFISKILSSIFPKKDKEEKTEEKEKGFLAKIFSSIFPGKNKNEEKKTEDLENKTSENKQTAEEPTSTLDANHVHEFSPATCTQGEVCSCGETVGEALGHTYVDAICTVCGEKDPNAPLVQEGVVEGKGVRVRSGPGVGTEVVTHNGKEIKLNTGHAVTVHGEKIPTEDITYPDWYKISFTYENTPYEGYMFSNHVKISTEGVTEGTTNGETQISTNDQNSGQHTHYYFSSVTKEPTCNAEGERTYACPCGDSYTETISKKKNHSYSARITRESTCTAEGEKTYTCTCGHSYTESISKTGHNWQSASCTLPKTCKTCGTTSGEPKGHEYSSYADFKCFNCGEQNPAVQNSVNQCSLQLPSLPQTANYFSDSKVTVTKIDYRFEYYGDGKVMLKAKISGTKTYDDEGNNHSSSCRFGWKLYNSAGSVVKSGTFISPDVAVNESFADIEATFIHNFEATSPDAFRLEIYDIK